MHKACACGSGLSYVDCCGRYIDGSLVAPSPEALMRSRYTAYTQAHITYISQTMQGPAARGFDADSAKQWAAHVRWLGLHVLKSNEYGDKGAVEFIALFNDGEQRQIHENSLFQKISGCWYYVDALPLPKQARNAPCPCGSGKKFKQCCR